MSPWLKVVVAANPFGLTKQSSIELGEFMALRKKAVLFFLSVLISNLSSTAVGQASAAERMKESCLQGVCFSTEKELGGKAVIYLGSARFKYLLFDVYTAALYGPRQWLASRRFSADAPSELIIEYHRPISAAQFAEAANDILSEQYTELSAELKADIVKLHQAYRDVQAGDRYTLSYTPESGTSLSLNDKLLVTIPGAEFAEHYFGIWLHPERPLDGKLREKLFGQA